VRLDPTVGAEIAKTRPCIVVTADIVNERRRTVVIIPISSGPLPVPPLNIPVTCQTIKGVAVIDQIRAASKERFGSLAGRLSQAEMSAVDDGLRRVLGI
jgi:mRNA interferase MazF